jgi:hypothetical protein
MSSALPLDALMVVAALVVLVLSIMFARAIRNTGPSRARRILVPTGIFVLGIIVLFALPVLFSSASAGLLWAAAEGFLWLALGALVAAAVAEGIVTTLEVERTPRALAAGIVAAVLLIYAWLVMRSGAVILEAGLLALIPGMIAAAAAIGWWPYLPWPEGELDESAGEVFE